MKRAELHTKLVAAIGGMKDWILCERPCFHSKMVYWFMFGLSSIIKEVTTVVFLAED